MIKVDQLREFIIKPALNDLLLYSEDAEELLIFTCAVESLGGTYLKQEHGPALGIYQMEPDTYNDIWQNYLKNNQALLLKFISNFGMGYMPSEDRLVYDLRFATAMCRIHYLRVSSKLPEKTDIAGIWNYYKQHYNTAEGAALQSESIEKYLTYIKA